MGTHKTTLAFVFITVLLGSIGTMARTISNFEKDIDGIVNENKAVVRGNDQSVSLSKLTWEDGDSIFLAITSKNFVGLTEDKYPLFLVNVFFLQEKNGKLSSSIFWQQRRFVVDKGQSGQIWIGKDGKLFPIRSLVRQQISDLPVELDEPGNLSGEIYYSLNEVRADEDLLADRSSEIIGTLGACYFNGLGGPECSFMKASQCNYSGVLELANISKSSRDFRFEPGMTCH